MQSRFLALLDSYSGHLDDAVDAAIARIPPPRSIDMLLAKFCALGVEADDVVVDLGCGHGQYAQQIASATGCHVVALDLSPQNLVETRAAIGDDEAARVHVARAVAEALPLSAQSVDYIWCRDMLYHVDLPRTMRECATALAPGGRMLVYHTFATELLEPGEAQRQFETSVIDPRNMQPAYFEACALDAGFVIEERDVIGSEWRESAEIEESRNTSGGGGLGAGLGTSGKLLRAARLLRGGAPLRRELGERAYEAALSDCLWGVYQMIGKLCPTAYVLRRG